VNKAVWVVLGSKASVFCRGLVGRSGWTRSSPTGAALLMCSREHEIKRRQVTVVVEHRPQRKAPLFHTPKNAESHLLFELRATDPKSKKKTSSPPKSDLPCVVLSLATGKQVLSGSEPSYVYRLRNVIKSVVSECEVAHIRSDCS